MHMGFWGGWFCLFTELLVDCMSLGEEWKAMVQLWVTAMNSL